MKESRKYALHSTFLLKVFFILIGIIMIVYCISLILPFVWTLYSSFKGIIDFTQNSYSLPSKWVFSNYPEVLKLLNVPVLTQKGLVEFNVISMFVISLVKSFSISALSIVCTAAVAYIIAKYSFVGRNFIYALGLFVMIMPIIGSFPTTMYFSKLFGIYDNLFLFIVTSPRCIFGSNFLILYAAYKSVSWHYAEAAQIDGAGHWRIMISIMLPMVYQICIVLFVLSFLGEWNDYSTVMIWLPSYPTLAYGMYYFQQNASEFGATKPQILAGFVIVMIPTVVLYLSSQKLILSKFNIGGLKG